ncbi:HD-GYP domain-containing protein [Bacillus sp. JCM 19034]|uniref:HD-GYP domain-containing protein n=1 Tax=Bacillus sp. JCM 19034 TaxID=1481928 RepID=UPI0007843EFE|nr:HD-GYP domain-containing protein [Bacillus sp. JCM 19034]
MEVKLYQVEPGCITNKEVPGLTKLPLVKRNTTLTEELLSVLKAFMVETIDVKPIKSNGESFTPSVIRPAMEHKPIDFVSLYLQAVKKYESLFKVWQSGKKVEVNEVRAVLLPLFKHLNKEHQKLIYLHHYSTVDDYLYHHSIYVGILSYYLAYKLHYSPGECIQIGLAGALADVGMAKVTPRLLTNEKSTLTDHDFEEIKKHPVFSYNMIKGSPDVTELMTLAILQHHERNDGSGYPLGIKEDKIHRYGQIIAVADVYHAMTTERHHRKKRSTFQVLEEISTGQFGKFEYQVIQALMQSINYISNGNRVRLSNGEEANIVFFDEQHPTRPLVKLDKGEMINLAHNHSIFIEELLE